MRRLLIVLNGGFFKCDAKHALHTVKKKGAWRLIFKIQNIVLQGVVSSMDILKCSLISVLINRLSLFLAVLGVHNLLNNPEFDEETTNSKGGKGPIRSKWMRSLILWCLGICRGCWQDRDLLNCRLYFLSPRIVELYNRMVSHASAVSQCNQDQPVHFAQTRVLTSLFGQKIKMMI